MASLGVSSRRLIFILHSKEAARWDGKLEKIRNAWCGWLRGKQKVFFSRRIQAEKLQIFHRFPIRTPRTMSADFLPDFFITFAFAPRTGGWVLVALENIFQLNSECSASCWDKKKAEKKENWEKVRSMINFNFSLFLEDREEGMGTKWGCSTSMWRTFPGRSCWSLFLCNS